MSKLKTLAVIGARSGSKSVFNKNIRLLGRKPLMAWAIEAAKKSKLIDRVFVSTDSPKYAGIARRYGAEVPFLRPTEISNDKSTDIEYLVHAVKWLEEKENWKPDIILRLMPTAPFCKPETISKCIKLLIKSPEADSVRAIALASHHPFKMWRTEGDFIKPAFTKKVTGFETSPNYPRQLFPKMYVHSNPIVVRYESLMKGRHLGLKTKYIDISEEDAIDIDNEIDFLLAKAVLKKRQRQGV